jgi:hypothetical protein
VLDRSNAEAASPRSRVIAFAGAAATAFAIAAWLGYTGIGYVIDGCGCYDPVRDDIVGGVLIGIALAFAMAGALLAVRALRLRRELRADG